MITSIGYRVKSKRGVQFRAWANKVLKEYLLKGYSVNQLDYSSLQQLDKRSSGVSANVYTSDKNDKISNDIIRIPDDIRSPFPLISVYSYWKKQN